jgi:DNA-binding response OmpR family regulator
VVTQQIPEGAGALHDVPVSYRSNGGRAARTRVALLEDSPAEAQAVIELLANDGHDVVHLKSGEAFLDMLRRDSFDVLILDWNVPDLSGYGVLRRVRDDLQSGVPVLMLTARGGEFEVVQALNGGADDYLVKPWRPFELLARIQVLLRGAGSPSAERRDSDDIEDWHFDAGGQIIRNGTEEFRLPHKEFEVARLLFRHLGRPLSREHLNQSLWSGQAQSRTIDTHVSRVRTRLGLTIDKGFQLQAVYGFGYRLDRVT